MTEIRFTVPGEARGKGRARAAVRGGFATVYTDAKTRSYENLVRMAAERALDGAPPLDEPITIQARVRVMPPASVSKKVRALMLENKLHPAKRPDLDNQLKAVLDGCNSVAFRDDCLIVAITAWKQYAPTAGVDVKITTIGEPPCAST